MDRYRYRRAAVVATFLVLGGALAFDARTASAQGPYGRNGYQDFPFNQGSLMYRPLKPGDPPYNRKPSASRGARRPSTTYRDPAPAAGSVRPNVAPGGYYYPATPYGSYYYPAQPGWSYFRR